MEKDIKSLQKLLDTIISMQYSGELSPKNANTLHRSIRRLIMQLIAPLQNEDR